MTDEQTKIIMELITAVSKINWKELQTTLRSIALTLFSQNAIYKARIQKGGRIKVPEEERTILGLEEGDIVQVILIPLKRRDGNEKGVDNPD